MRSVQSCDSALRLRLPNPWTCPSLKWQYLQSYKVALNCISRDFQVRNDKRYLRCEWALTAVGGFKDISSSLFLHEPPDFKESQLTDSRSSRQITSQFTSRFLHLFTSIFTLKMCAVAPLIATLQSIVIYSKMWYSLQWIAICREPCTWGKGWTLT